MLNNKEKGLFENIGDYKSLFNDYKLVDFICSSYEYNNPSVGTMAYILKLMVKTQDDDIVPSKIIETEDINMPKLQFIFDTNKGKYIRKTSTYKKTQHTIRTNIEFTHEIKSIKLESKEEQMMNMLNIPEVFRNSGKNL